MGQQRKIVPREKGSIQVVIPVRNAERTLSDTITALQSAGLHPENIVVVLDASHDRSEKIALAQKTKIIKLIDGCGPGMTRNIGARNARAAYILFCDADVEIRASALNKALWYLRRFPQISGVQGIYSRKMKNPDALSSFKHAKQLGNILALPQGFTPVCGSSLLLMRREDFEAAGGFPVHWKTPSIEDRVMGNALFAKGRPLYLTYRFQGNHNHRYGLRDFIRTEFGRARDEITSMQKLGRGRAYVNPFFRILYLASALAFAGLSGAVFFPVLAPLSLTIIAVVILLDIWRLQKSSRFFHALWPAVALLDHVCVTAGATAGALSYLKITGFGSRNE